MGAGRAWNLFKNLTLLFLSLVLLPINTLVAAVAYGWHKIRGDGIHQEQKPHHDSDEDVRTVLITGVNMTKGLSLARMFHRRGHRVVGADWHSRSVGSVSRALDAYHRLPSPLGPTGVNSNYIDAFLKIIFEERVELWISVSDVTAAIADAAVKEIIEKRTAGVKCIQLNVNDTEVLHEKSKFMEHTKQLGLPMPITEVIHNNNDAVNFLQRNGGLHFVPGAKQFLIKPIGVDDAARIDMPLLPMTSDVKTIARLQDIEFDQPGSSYIIQEFIRGQEFCTHSVVIHGKVRAFVACPSTDVLTHYVALPADSPLSKAMLDFTAKQVASFGPDFTGHVSFDFLVDQSRELEKSFDEESLRIYPIECNPRVHTATVLFENDLELVDIYLSVLSASEDHILTPLSPTSPGCYYWIAQDVVELVLNPIFMACFQRTISLAECWGSIRQFLYYLRNGTDGVFRAWDPWPFWWMCHVYWPVQFLLHLVYGSWVKINVSTGKIFLDPQS